MEDIEIREYKESDNEDCLRLLNQPNTLSKKSPIIFKHTMESYKSLGQQFIQYDILLMTCKSTKKALGVITLGFETILFSNSAKPFCFIIDLSIDNHHSHPLSLKQHLLLSAELLAKHRDCIGLFLLSNPKMPSTTSILKSLNYINPALIHKKVFLTIQSSGTDLLDQNKDFEFVKTMPVESQEMLEEYYERTDVKVVNTQNLLLPELSDAAYAVQCKSLGIRVGANVWVSPVSQICTRFFLSSKVLGAKWFRAALSALLIIVMALCLWGGISYAGVNRYFVLCGFVVLYLVAALLFSYFVGLIRRFVGKIMKLGRIYGFSLKMSQENWQRFRDGLLDKEIKEMTVVLIQKIREIYFKKQFFSLILNISEGEDGKTYLLDKDFFLVCCFCKTFEQSEQKNYLTERFFIDPRLNII